MFQVTSSETMKCPSKEIDKNNISLLLSKPQFLNSLFESQHSLCLFLLVVLWWFFFLFFVVFFCCFFLQSMAVWCVCVGASGGGWGTLRSVLSDPCLVLFGSARLRGCRFSLFLSDAGPRLAHTSLTLCCVSNLLHCAIARPGAEKREGVLWV